MQPKSKFKSILTNHLEEKVYREVSKLGLLSYKILSCY